MGDYFYHTPSNNFGHHGWIGDPVIDHSIHSHSHGVTGQHLGNKHCIEFNKFIKLRSLQPVIPEQQWMYIMEPCIKGHLEGSFILIGICTLQASQHLVIVRCPITGLVPLIKINWLQLHKGTELGWTLMKTLFGVWRWIYDPFLAPTGAQGVTLSVHLSVWTKVL